MVVAVVIVVLVMVVLGFVIVIVIVVMHVAVLMSTLLLFPGLRDTVRCRHCRTASRLRGEIGRSLFIVPSAHRCLSQVTKSLQI
jgi:cbb3-type cytochrome oxidase cytochrome c subunit